MQEGNQQNVDFILKKIKEKINALNDIDLANWFGVKSGTISAWRVRNSIDYALLIDKCKDYGFDLNEILLGKSTVCGESLQAEESKVNYGNANINLILKILSERENTILKLSKEIGILEEKIRILKENKKTVPQL